jgi:non-ribosomal peptide synthetase component F
MANRKMPENETPGRPVGKAPERLPWPPFDPAAPLHAGWAGSVLERFKSHVRRQPEAIAATAGAEILTYAGLDAASDRLAEQILSRAVGSKQMVSIVGGRHPRLVIALMGAIKAGFAFHVIDPKYPPRRIADYLSYVSPAGILNAARRPEEAESALQFHQPAGPCFRIEVAAGKRSPARRELPRRFGVRTAPSRTSLIGSARPLVSPPPTVSAS